MAVRKIELMHELFGTADGTCGDCSNLVCHIWDKRYYKCKVYGISNSEATDWALRWQACGLKDKPIQKNRRNVVELVRPEKKQNTVDDGQQSIFEGGG